MKIEFTCDNDNWLQVTLTAETVQEASELVRHRLNADAASRRVFDVYAGKQAVVGSLCLQTRKTNRTSYVI